MILTPENFTPSAELQRLTETAQARRAAYLDTQATYVECEQETHRLEQAAAALEAEAKQVNADWKARSMERGADHRKINAEIERGIKLEMEAEKFRRHAAAREELRFEMAKHMHQARTEAAPACRAVTAQAIREHVAALLATEGLAEVIGELRAVLSMAKQEGLESVRDNVASLDIGALVSSIAAPNAKARAEQLRVYLPAPISGEMPECLSHLQKKAFELSKGQTTNLLDARALAHAV